MLINGSANYDSSLFGYEQNGTTVTVKIQFGALNAGKVCIAFAHDSNCSEIFNVSIQGIWIHNDCYFK